MTTAPSDPRRLDALGELIGATKEFLACQMGDEFLRLESGELAVMLEAYLRRRQKTRPPVVTVRRGGPAAKRPGKRPRAHATLATPIH